MVKYLLRPESLSYDLDLSLNGGRVSRYLKNNGHSAIQKYVNRGLELGNRLVEARGIYAVSENNRDVIENFHLPGPLREAKLLFFGVSTIGDELEEKVHTLMEEGNYTLSNILDSVGSAAVDETSDFIGNKLFEYAEKHDLKTTRAFQPGSGASHWKVKNQRLIFNHANPSEIGVSLTPSFTMTPKKSNSFVVGLAENIDQVEDLFSCVGCERTDCPYRFIPGR